MTAFVVQDETVEITEDQLLAVSGQVDWSVLDSQVVLDKLATASRRVSAQFEGVTTAGDLYQEGAIWCALNAADVRAYLADELHGERNLYVRLSSRMADKARSEARHVNRGVPLHIVLGEERDATEG
ncbi:MAG TPA: hypothetical protein VHO01_16485 [Jatrophihabitans sp.]|nr:hypothetical protein [Jatrophihabitans sp.]